MLKQRLGTAFLLMPMVLGIVCGLASQLVAACLSIVVAIGAWEWASLCKWQKPQTSAWLKGGYLLLVILSLGLVDGLWLILPISGMVILVVACGWWLVAFSWVRRYQISAELWRPSVGQEIGVGLCMLVPPWLALLMLHHQGGGEIVAFLLILVWMADSGAYWVGQQWGHCKLASRVSPGKTWEGLLGGLVLSQLVSYAWFKNLPLNEFLAFWWLSLVTVIVSVLGDLLESLFKRQKSCKDSGQLLPGHGGILDRIDSLTSAAPVFTLGYYIIIGKIA